MNKKKSMLRRRPDPEELTAYFCTQALRILSPVGFHCIPYSEEEIYIHKKSFLWHHLIKELIDEAFYSVEKLARLCKAEKNTIEKIHTRSLHYIHLDTVLQNKLIILHWQNLGPRHEASNIHRQSIAENIRNPEKTFFEI